MQKFLKVIIVVFTIAIIVFFIKDSYLATNSKGEYNSLHPAVLIFFALYLYTIVKYYNLSIKENSKKLQELNKQLVARNNLLQLNNEALKVLLEIRKMISISQNVKVTLEKISQSCNEKLNFKTGVFMLSADKKTLDLIISPCFCSDEKKQVKISYDENSEYWQVLQSGENLYFSQFDCTSLNTPADNELEKLSCYLMPIKVEANNIGVVTYLFDSSVKEFAEIVFNYAPLVTQEITTAIKNSKTYVKLLEQAEKDELTGLYNYRHFKNKLNKMFEESKNGEYSLGLIMIDVDNFKDVNDTMGHSYGDKVLSAVAASIKSSIRENDIACRYGGDEFVVLMPGITTNILEDVSLRVINSIQNNKDIPKSVTISVGGTVNKEKIKTPEELLEIADRAMYKAKDIKNSLKIIS